MKHLYNIGKMSDDEDPNINRSNLFTPLCISTISMNGTIDNVSPDEKEDGNRMECIGPIVEIANNFDCKTTPSYMEYKKKHEKKSRTSTITKHRRKKHSHMNKGTGTHQASQITFVVKSPAGRYYKIKVFRKGSIQVPGVVKENGYVDIVESLCVLVNYLRWIYSDNSIRMSELFTSMKNYCCKLQYTHFRINLSKMKELLRQYKMNNPFKEEVKFLLNCVGLHEEKKDNVESEEEDEDDDIRINIGLPNRPKMLYNVIHKGINTYSNEGIFDMIRIMCGHTKEQMAEIIQDPDKSASSLSVKFYRSPVKVFKVMREKDPKRTTVKIMQSGKINIEGGNSYEEAAKIRDWLTQFIRDRQDVLLGNIEEPYVYDPDESESGESIYADFIPARNGAKKYNADL
jgi:hypothetical protein